MAGILNVQAGRKDQIADGNKPHTLAMVRDMVVAVLAGARKRGVVVLVFSSNQTNALQTDPVCLNCHNRESSTCAYCLRKDTTRNMMHAMIKLCLVEDRSCRVEVWNTTGSHAVTGA